MSVYPMNKKFIVCESLKVRLNLVSSLVFSLFSLSGELTSLSVPVQFNRLWRSLFQEVKKKCYFLCNDSFSNIIKTYILLWLTDFLNVQVWNLCV